MPPDQERRLFHRWVSMNIDAVLSASHSRFAERRRWVLESGIRYWPTGREYIQDLAIPEIHTEATGRIVEVRLPTWAHDLGVGAPSVLLVDQAAVAEGPGADHERCDWIAAAFLHLTGAAERLCATPADAGYSYFSRLAHIDGRLFERAWVNRIFLFLRRWAARSSGQAEDSLFGPLPAPTIDLTHDVDAVSKTLEIRLKQSAFHTFNAMRAIARRDPRQAVTKLVGSVRFALRTGGFWTFAEIRRLEERAGLRSTFHFYGGPPGLRRRSPISLLVDPAYDVSSNHLKEEIGTLVDGGWTVGLHQGFSSWKSPEKMRVERAAVETASRNRVTRCRQHWLRFSWRDTWRAQEAAGLKLDSTLGFNDRPGFRNGAALIFRPWQDDTGHTLSIHAVPMVFMDSHFYDYEMMTAQERTDAMAHWIGEIRAVRGQASVCWHTHSIGPDYGWGQGFRELLELIQ